MPADALLSPAYAAARRSLIDPRRASLETRPGAVDRAITSEIREFTKPSVPVEPKEPGDTTSIQVADGAGNLFSATPSSGWLLGGAFVAGEHGRADEQPHAGIPSRRGEPERARGRETSANDADADDRPERRGALPGDRDAGRRQPGSADPARPAQHHRFRHGRAGGDRSAARELAASGKLVRRPSLPAGRPRGRVDVVPATLKELAARGHGLRDAPCLRDVHGRRRCGYGSRDRPAARRRGSTARARPRAW